MHVDGGPGDFDAAAALERLADGVVVAVRELGRRGAVVGVSGGVDSGVVAGICARALGPERVLALLMPERDGAPESGHLGRELASALGIASEEEPITPALEALGCYRRRDEAIRAVFPDYEPGWPHKLRRSAPGTGVIVFSLVVRRPDGREEARRMPAGPYRALIAATNMKQRVRKLLEYSWADRLGYAVAGTPNRLEFEQGFFVKGGDGLADVKPIARLYKGQVYALARELGLPDGIATRAPTTDTFSLAQSQEEFYFGHAHERMDELVWGYDNDVGVAELARRTSMAQAAVAAAYGEIERVRAATRYLHAPAQVLEP